MKHGVYQIRNLVNGRLYIGSSAGKGFNNRWTTHVGDLNQQRHHSPKLQAAWNKYGSGAFVFEILLYCDAEDALDYEQSALDYYKPFYNTCPTAGNQLGFRHSTSSRQKMSNSHRGKTTPLHRGSLHSRSKVSEADVQTIRELLTVGIKQKDIAAQFGNTQPAVSRIKNGSRWEWLQ